MASAAKLATARCKSTVQTTIAAERNAAIAYWIEQMPSASTARIAGYAGTSSNTVSNWRKAHKAD